MVALHEQHLNERPPVGVEFRGIDLDLLTRRGLHGASRGVAAVDDHVAQLATAVRRGFRMVAEVRDVDARL
jgi:hypothetical protein